MRLQLLFIFGGKKKFIMTTLLVASFLTRLTQDEKWDLVNVTLEIPIKDFDNNCSL